MGSLASKGFDGRRENQENLVGALAGRLGRMLGLKRAHWRNAFVPFACRLLIILMLLLMIVPPSSLMACACSQIVVGTNSSPANSISIKNTDGSLKLTQSDIQIPGVTGIRVVRKYWSSDRTWGPFGQGWTLPFCNYLIKTDGDISAYMSGIREDFKASNQYVNATNSLKVSFIGTNEIKMEDTHGNRWYFDLINKWMTCSFDRNWNETDYTWKVVQKQVGVDSDGKPQTAPVYCPLTVTYQDGRQLLFSYDDPNLQYLCTQVETTSSGFKVNYTYTDGLLTGIAKANGQVLQYGYYIQKGKYKTRGWLTSITYSNGGKVQIVYNGNYNRGEKLRVASITGPDGYINTYSYSDTDSTFGMDTVDQKNNISSVKRSRQPGGAGGTITNIDPVGNASVTTVNSNGQPTQVKYRKGNSVYFTYDTNNKDNFARRNVLSKSDDLGQVWTYKYNSNNRITEKTDPLGNKVKCQYDAFQRPISLTNALGQMVLSKTYNGYGKTESVSNGVGDTVKFQYNASGYCTNEVDAAGQAWSASYDADGNKLKFTNPLGESKQYSYDKFYKVASVSNDLGQTKSFVRDDMGNLTKIQDANGNTLVLNHDSLQRLTDISNALGGVTKFTYSDSGNLAAVADPLGHAYSYHYDKLGRIESLSYPDGGSKKFEYDANDQIISSTDQLGQVTTYSYDADNKIVGKNYPKSEGGGVSYTYDAANRLTGFSKSIGSSVIAKTALQYNAANKVISANENGDAIGYQYDKAERLRASNKMSFGDA